MGSAFQWRRFVYAQAAFVLVLVVGTAGFQAILGEGWVSSFYRTVVTTTLTGLDSQPPGAGAERSAERADDPRGDRALKAERVADRNDQLADP